MQQVHQYTDVGRTRRNLLVLLQARFQLRHAHVVCLRTPDATASASRFLSVTMGAGLHDKQTMPLYVWGRVLAHKACQLLP